MENNYESMKMPELRAIAKRNGLRGHCKLRKAGLIEFLRSSLGPPRSAWEPIREDEPAIVANMKRAKVQVTGPSRRIEEHQPSKSKIKRDNRRKSKMKKESIRLRNEINKLESQRDEIKEKIKKIVRGAHSGFKKKKIRNMN